MKTHKFDVEDAERYGVEKAILLEHLKFHQQANRGNKDLEFDGKTYAFLKPETVKEMYPYLNISSVRRWLRELEDEGVIESFKPKARNGEHLKYYHVKSLFLLNSQNDQSNSQNERSKNSQNERSSILPNEVPNEGESFLGRIENADNKKDLLDVWDSYRRKKGKHANLYEREVILKKEWVNKSPTEIADAILYTVKNGWVTLQYPDDEDKDKDFNPEIARMR